MRSTQEILDHHLECFGRGDLDGILADYSSAAVMLTPTGALTRGLRAARGNRQHLTIERERLCDAARITAGGDDSVRRSGKPGSAPQATFRELEVEPLGFGVVEWIRSQRF